MLLITGYTALVQAAAGQAATEAGDKASQLLLHQ
jgi:hypothetical protein